MYSYAVNVQLVGPYSTPASTGGAGLSTGNIDTGYLRGQLVGVYIKYNDAPPAGTTDVTIKTKGTDPRAPSYNLLVITNAATDGWFYPQVQVHTTAGAAIANNYTPQVVDDIINIAIAQANDGDSVTVWFLVAA